MISTLRTSHESLFEESLRHAARERRPLPPMPCDACGGRGWVRVAVQGPDAWSRRCAACDGQGRFTLWALAARLAAHNVDRTRQLYRAFRCLSFGMAIKSETATRVLDVLHAHGLAS